VTRAYLRLDPGFFERKRIQQGYSAGQVSALIGVFCLAESQPERGRFRDARLLRALLGADGKELPTLISRGDVVVMPDGRLYPVGWDEWQEGDWKVGERIQRIRKRRTNGQEPAP
jgi:transcriptional regulator with XRE-family HTH domain